MLQAISSFLDWLVYTPVEFLFSVVVSVLFGGLLLALLALVILMWVPNDPRFRPAIEWYNTHVYYRRKKEI
jgi:ABC-type dipeptide/oligopeptide/nickel transport system permease subunit